MSTNSFISICRPYCANTVASFCANRCLYSAPRITCLDTSRLLMLENVIVHTSMKNSCQKVTGTAHSDRTQITSIDFKLQSSRSCSHSHIYHPTTLRTSGTPLRRKTARIINPIITRTSVTQRARAFRQCAQCRCLRVQPLWIR